MVNKEKILKYPSYLVYGSLLVSFLSALWGFTWLSTFSSKVFLVGLVLIFVVKKIKQPEKGKVKSDKRENNN